MLELGFPFMSLDFVQLHPHPDVGLMLNVRKNLHGKGRMAYDLPWYCYT